MLPPNLALLLAADTGIQPTCFAAIQPCSEAD